MTDDSHSGGLSGGSVPETGPLFIDGYGNGGFRIAGIVRSGSLFVLPDRVLEWNIASFNDATADGFAPLLEHAGSCELLLIGAGARMQLVPAAIRQACKAAGIAVEPMDTGAAARTYNVLLAEDRRVAAALIAV